MMYNLLRYFVSFTTSNGPDSNGAIISQIPLLSCSFHSIEISLHRSFYFNALVISRYIIASNFTNENKAVTWLINNCSSLWPCEIHVNISSISPKGIYNAFSFRYHGEFDKPDASRLEIVPCVLPYRDGFTPEKNIAWPEA